MQSPYIIRKLNIGTWTYLFINILTLGWFYFYWAYKMNSILTEVTTDKELGYLTHRLYQLFTLSFTGYLIGTALTITEYFVNSEALNNVAGIIVFMSAILTVFWSFTARALLRIHAEKTYNVYINPNGILVFFFPGLSLTYAVNSIEDKMRLNNTENKM